MMALRQRQGPLPKQRQNLRFFQKMKILGWSRAEVLRRTNLDAAADRPSAADHWPNPTDLRDRLIDDLCLDLPRAEGPTRKMVEALVGNLDDRGFLADGPALLSRFHGVPSDRVDQLLTFLKNFEGRGIGCRNMTEFLAFQLAKRSEPWAKAALEALRKNRQQFPNFYKILRHLERSLEVDQFDQVLNALKMRQLSTSPIELHSAQPEAVALPDLIVTLADGRPSIHSTQTETMDRIANGILRWALAERERTLLLLAREIFDRQLDFLQRGIVGLHPLAQRDLAGRLALHPSTVSRALAHKYVRTAFGTYPLGVFASNGRRCNSLKIRHALVGLSADDSKFFCRTDRQLADLLSQQMGLTVSPRTICKHRNQLFTSQDRSDFDHRH